jgi:hypothetical protein
MAHHSGFDCCHSIMVAFAKRRCSQSIAVAFLVPDFWVDLCHRFTSRAIYHLYRHWDIGGDCKFGVGAAKEFCRKKS